MPPLDSADFEGEFKSLSDKMRGVTEETKRFAEAATKEIKNFGALSEETKARADESLLKLGETNARLQEIEQKLARRGKEGEGPELKSLGQHVIDCDRVKAMNSGTRGSASLKVELKDVTSASTTTGATAVAGNSLVSADRQGGFQQLIPDRRMTVRDLITPGETSSSAIEYVVETGWTNSAAPVAEAALKPKSDVVFDLRNAPVRTLAHFFKASRQIMDDAPQLKSIIDGRLRYGLQLVEEAQLLNGSGTGANIKGIITAATAFAAPFAMTTPSTIDQLRLALLQASLAEYPASGIVVHLTDLAKMEVLKDTTGNYLIGNPRSQLTPTLWGLPVVATQAMTAGNYLVGAFKLGAQIFDRMAIEVLISTENEDDFIKNMCTIRGEERLAMCIYRPGAFITGTFT